jgi:hypothetical protein
MPTGASRVESPRESPRIELGGNESGSGIEMKGRMAGRREGFEFIIVVSGLPRSGTSLMMRILERAGVPILSDGVRKADSDNPNGYYELEAVKRLRDDASCLDGAEGSAVKIIHMLLPHLPAEGRRYRVLMMRRNLTEVMQSQARMLGRRGTPAIVDEEEGDRALEEAFAKQLAHIDGFLQRSPSFAVLDVDYNRLLEDPRPQLAAVVRFLGLDVELDELARMVDPSLYRIRVRSGSSDA